VARPARARHAGEPQPASGISSPTWQRPSDLRHRRRTRSALVTCTMWHRLAGCWAGRPNGRQSGCQGFCEASPGYSPPRQVGFRLGRVVSWPIQTARFAAVASSPQRMSLAGSGRQCGGMHRCLRHVTLLRAADPAASRLLTGVIVARGREIAAGLGAAFTERTRTGRLPELPRDASMQRAPRNDPAGREANTWRRAAAFLDGSVLGGCPADGP
jgi:hypothetical protein